MKVCIPRIAQELGKRDSVTYEEHRFMAARLGPISSS